MRPFSLSFSSIHSSSMSQFPSQRTLPAVLVHNLYVCEQRGQRFCSPSNMVLPSLSIGMDRLPGHTFSHPKYSEALTPRGYRKGTQGLKGERGQSVAFPGESRFLARSCKKTSGICHFVTKQRLESLVNTQAIHLGLETVFAQLKS